jgi:hypothetical protein
MKDHLDCVEVRQIDGIVVYYGSTKRKIKIKPISECRYDERLKNKTEESTGLVYTGMFVYVCLL